MTHDQITLVQNSFDSLWSVRQQISRAFYDRFFVLAPDARRLFPDDLESQRMKFMDSLSAMVGALDNNQMLRSILSQSGRDHVRFGANAGHFIAFREALIGGLEEQLGDSFTPEVKEAWLLLYENVQTEMQRARR